MAENLDYKEVLQFLNEFEVECLIVGGFAVMKYGEPRYTKDLGVWSTIHERTLAAWSKRSRGSVPGQVQRCLGKTGREHFFRCSGPVHLLR